MIDNQLDEIPIPPLPFFNRHRPKLIALLFWLSVAGIYWGYANRYNLSPDDVVRQLADWFVNSLYGPFFFIIFFALQPLVFFPSFILGIAGGILYGPMFGVIYVILGGNGAAHICYLVGRFFGQGILTGAGEQGLIERYAVRLRNNTFETILIMHLLIVVPFDIVNYIAGFLQMNWRQFGLATAVGALPGIFTFVMFGHSLGTIDKLMAGHPEINFRSLTLSLIMLGVGLVLSYLVKRREKRLD